MIKPGTIFNGEIGTLEGVRFIETTEAKKFTKAGASGIDIPHCCWVKTHTTTKIEGWKRCKGTGKWRYSDPLEQRSVGWKAMKVTEILSQQYMVRIETASTYNDHKAN